ncbi:MAG: dipeptide epimerase [Acidobacteria bacterium]|nr:dipeptide epimerase [Acidobacteriota bacterium]
MNDAFRIASIAVHPLRPPLKAPFRIASGGVDSLENLAVSVRLEGGAVGWGEISTLPGVTHEDGASARQAAEAEAVLLGGGTILSWRRLAREMAERRPRDSSVRAGFEMAILDALAKQAGLPLFAFLGGAADTLETDITIPICPPEEAERLARHYRGEGFRTIKVKIGLDLSGDIPRLSAIRRGFPDCRLVLDANAGYTVEEAFRALAELRAAGMEPALLEQPVAREDWEGMAKLTREAGVPVAADESCRGPADALRIVRERAASVVNIKLAKCGVAQALEIAAIAGAGGLGLMVGGMVETRLAMGFSAHFAAGLGGFDWIDLDTPVLLAEDWISGGPRIRQARYRLDPGVPGHGGELAPASPR